MIFSLCFVLFAVGLYGVMTKKNVVKIVLGVAIMEYGVNLFLILIGYRHPGEGAEAMAPIMDAGAVKNPAEFLATSVDPIPQALVLTSIVISLGVLALLVAMCMRLYERYGTFDITEMRKLRG